MATIQYIGITAPTAMVEVVTGIALKKRDDPSPMSSSQATCVEES